jgi:hypothetical protein
MKAMGLISRKWFSLASAKSTSSWDTKQGTAVVLQFPAKTRSTPDLFEFWIVGPWKTAIMVNCAWMAMATWPLLRPSLRDTAEVVPIR